jgi:hypothetical protein
MRRISLLALGALLLVGGCNTVPQIDNDTAIDPSEGYFVMGITPPNVEVSVWSGRVENGRFIQIGKLHRPGYANIPLDGYMVGETHGDEANAIWFIQFKTADNALYTGKAFVPCHETRTFVFEAPPGKVIYMGDAAFDPGQSGAFSAKGYDFAKAQAYMRGHFPKLADRLEAGHFKLLPTDRGSNCAVE